MDTNNLILLGEAPGNYAKYDPARHALFPHPPNCAGYRLCILMGMQRSEYISLDRRNLLDYYPGKQDKGAKFPHGATRQAVKALHESNDLVGHNVLLVGKRLADAFGLDNYEILRWHHMEAWNFAIVPHPSGINRWWNDPVNKDRGRVFLRRVAEQARDGATSYS